MPRAIKAQGALPHGQLPKPLYLAQCKFCEDGVVHANHGPQIRLMEAIEDGTAEEILYGGAAGGGKSYALRMLLVNYCLQYPGARAVLFRRTYQELEDTHISMLQQELPQYVAQYKVGSHSFQFLNGSELLCRYCEKEEDVYKYDTFEADIMAFDELTAFSEFQYVYLLTRCRSAKKWWPGRKIIAATNPGNVGHVWVKGRWVDYVRPYEVKTGPEMQGGMRRMFIPAKLSDNPALERNDPSYGATLKGLPDEIYRAKALGDWSVFSGQFFQRWRESVHVVDDFRPPAEWQRYMTVDWGIASPYACYWAARPPGTRTLYVYREHYGANVSTFEQAQRAFESTMASGEKIEFIVGDPSMWAKERDAHGEYQASNASYWRTAFAGVTEIVKGNNERVMGAALMREVLDWSGIEDEEGIRILTPPRLYFMRQGCPNAIRTIPALVHSETNAEDVNTKGEDHSYDAIRYLARQIFTGPGSHGKSRYVIAPDGSVLQVAA